MLLGLLLGRLLGLVGLVGGLVLCLLGLVSLLAHARGGHVVVVAADLAVGADPLVGRGGLVDALELVVGRAGHVRELGGAVGGDVAGEDADVLEELARLGVSEDQASEGAEVLDGLLAVLLGLLLVHGLARLRRVRLGRVDVAGLHGCNKGRTKLARLHPLQTAGRIRTW